MTQQQAIGTDGVGDFVDADLAPWEGEDAGGIFVDLDLAGTDNLAGTDEFGDWEIAEWFVTTQVWIDAAWSVRVEPKLSWDVEVAQKLQWTVKVQGGGGSPGG